VTTKDFTTVEQELPSQWTQLGKHEVDFQVMSLIAYTREMRDSMENRIRKPTHAAINVVTLINSFEEVSLTYYKAALELTYHLEEQGQIKSSDRAYLLHSIVRKLTNEWIKIEHLIPAALLTRERWLKLLTSVVKGAQSSLKLEEKEEIGVIPLFGDSFELTNFSYAPGVYMLSIPAFDLYNPWRWSVIWHELAGLLMKKDTVRQIIQDFAEDATAEKDYPKEKTWKTWTTKWNALPREKTPVETVNQKGLKVTLEPADVAEFGLSRHDWVEEFVEDACTILPLGPIAYEILKDVLIQHYGGLQQGGDSRHPLPILRMEVAYQLLEIAQKNLISMSYPDSIAESFEKYMPDIRTHREKEHGDVLNDEGAKAIAEWIFQVFHNQHEFIVGRLDVGTAAKVAREIVIDAYTSVKELKMAEMTQEKIDQTIEAIREKAHQNLRDHDLIEPDDTEFSYNPDANSRANSKRGDKESIIAEIRSYVERGEWENLANLSLSQTDQLAAAPGTHAHNNADGSDCQKITITLSGSTNQPWLHSASLTYNHKHPGGGSSTRC